MPFSIPVANAQIGFSRAFRYLHIYSKAAAAENVVKSFIMRKIVSGAFEAHYCRLWIDQTNLLMEEVTKLPEGYTEDPELNFNSLDFGYFGTNEKHFIVGTGDVRYKMLANPPVTPAPQVIRYDWPTDQGSGLIFTCKADHRLTIYRKGTGRNIINFPETDQIYNP